MPQPGRTSVANGNIAPSRAIKIDTSVKDRVLQGTDGSSNHGDPCIGISMPGSRNAPYSTLDDGYVAIAGENVGYYQDGTENVPAELGGSVTAGDFLKADSSGKLITSSTAGDWVLAQARIDGASGDLINVDVRIFMRS